MLPRILPAELSRLQRTFLVWTNHNRFWILDFRAIPLNFLSVLNTSLSFQSGIGCEVIIKIGDQTFAVMLVESRLYSVTFWLGGQLIKFILHQVEIRSYINMLYNTQSHCSPCGLIWLVIKLRWFQGLAATLVFVPIPRFCPSHHKESCHLASLRNGRNTNAG